jgi:hypothetical protein
MYPVQLKLIFIYQVNLSKPGFYLLVIKQFLFSIGDVAGPYFWQGLNQILTSDTLIRKTTSPAEGGLIGFSTMIYNIIYLRQGHGAKGFDRNKLFQLLDNANIGNIYYFILLINNLLSN